MGRLSVRITKKVLALTICAVAAVNMVSAALPLAESSSVGSRDVLNTNVALGSPLLNLDNFNTEDWNEWETLCWGVFLSNFAQPLIDNYDSAFNRQSKEGSKGKGFNALWGGSGSDPSNIKVIEALCDYAIENQTKASEPIYVSYTKLDEYDIVVDGKGAIKKATDIKDADVRVAKFRDLFFSSRGYSHEKIESLDASPITSVNYKFNADWGDETSNTNIEENTHLGFPMSAVRTSNKGFQEEYDYIWSPYDGWIPTFYVKRGDSYIPILNYTDWWDCQIPALIINGCRADSAINTTSDGSSTDSGPFKDAFTAAWDADKEIEFDSFGNITVNNGTMVIPAAINRNITAEHSINLLNSWVMNNYVATYDKEEVVLGMRQSLNAENLSHALLHKIDPDTGDGDDEYDESILGFDEETGMDNIMCNGMPALGRSTIGPVCMLYYDLDSIVMHDSLAGSPDRYGNQLLRLLETDISTDELASKVPLKIEIAGSKERQSQFFGDKYSDAEQSWVTSAMVANQMPNILYQRFTDYETYRNVNKPANTKILSRIIFPDTKPGEKGAKLFSEDPIFIAPKVLQSTPSKENNKPTNQGATRTFLSYLCDSWYRTNASESILTRSRIVTALSDATWEKVREDSAKYLLPTFQREYTKYDYTKTDKKTFLIFGSKKNVATKWRSFWDGGDNETVNLNTNRIIKAYPPSKEMVAAAKVLGIVDGAEFGTYCTYIYMTYLNFYGVDATVTLANGVKNSCAFDAVIFSRDSAKSGILIRDIGKELYKYEANFGDQVDIEKEVLQNSYLMLDPEKGRDYRKKIIENSMADWMFEQYNKTVYGGKTEYSGSASKARSGFLSIEPYADNFLTAPFLSRYVDVVVWLIMGVTLLIILFAILKSKKISWVVISMIIAVNTILIVPSSGEIVPYLTSRATTKMFYNKMTFWSMSEGITNQQLAADIIRQNKEFANMSEEESAVVWTMVRDLSVVQTDASLCVKQDISQKVTQKVENSTYENIENYKSARWILPMVMQQFSGEEATESFIYKPLQNIWEDMSNMYWYFRPADAVATNDNCPTITSGQVTDVNSNNDRASLDTTSTISAKSKKDSKDKKDKDESDKSIYKDSKYSLYDKIKSIYPDYVDAKDRAINSMAINESTRSKYASSVPSDVNVKINFRSYSWTLNGGSEKEAHKIIYLLDEYRAPLALSKSHANLTEYSNANWWQTYIDASKHSLIADNWRTDSPYTESDTDTTEKDENGNPKTIYIENPNAPRGFEFTADQYDRESRASITYDLPYLLSTESPIYYMYAVIKDSFPIDASLGKLTAKLQGATYKNDDGNVVRSSQLMYATISDASNPEEVSDGSRRATTNEKSSQFRQYSIGVTRDMLDLEEMFYNMIPYMYKMSITANGFDGDTGLLQNTDDPDYGSYKISKELMYYGGERQSWMYRCNWATKLMENPTFSQPKTVKDSSGKKYTVNNPMMPQCYPKERPMVFSDAQKEYLGLEDSDLNIVELKCCKVNRDVSRKWTLMLNYIGTPGVTREVVYRQMATDATLIFCEEFSSSGIIDTAYTLYPQSLDLRYMSFDSLAKMLMINVSHSTSYIYGDTMLNVLSDSDMVTAVILLITAWVCAFLIPLIRAVLMAIIFYLGFWAALKAIFYSGKEKANIACGQMITNVLFMIYTIGYYFVFYVLTRLTSGEEVLDLDRISAEAGSPAWILLIVLLFSILYVVGMIFHIKFCVTNRGDMGYSQYSMLASSIADSISSSASRTKSAISNFFGGDSNTSGTSNTNSIKGTGTRDQLTDVNVKSNESNAQSTFGGSQSSRLNSSSTSSNVYNYNRSDTELESEYNAVFSYSDTEIDREEETGGTTADDINAQIDFGAEHSRDGDMN